MHNKIACHFTVLELIRKTLEAMNTNVADKINDDPLDKRCYQNKKRSNINSKGS